MAAVALLTTPVSGRPTHCSHNCKVQENGTRKNFYNGCKPFPLFPFSPYLTSFPSLPLTCPSLSSSRSCPPLPAEKQLSSNMCIERGPGR